MLTADYVIVGAGLTGVTIARLLKDRGKEVLIVDRKDHIAGNIYDYRHESGITIHKYGPHYFRCNSPKIWSFLNRFASFYNWSATIKTTVANDYFTWPVTKNYIDKLVGEDWKLFQGIPANFEEACLSKMPVEIYERFIKGYTEKQWGVDAYSLSERLASRITINEKDVNTLTPNHKWNSLPVNGYTALVENMINDIPVQLNVDYRKYRSSIKARKLLVYTGPIDEFFNFKYGRLTYRGQNRVVEYLPTTQQYQPCIQVNYPDCGDPRIRTIEWKHLAPGSQIHDIKGTVVSHEVPFTPSDPGEFEYPFPDRQNSDLYLKYRKNAQALKDVLICGRLGEYKYYDMDQAIGRAMALAGRIVDRLAPVSFS